MSEIYQKIDYWFNRGDVASESWYSEANSYCSNLSLIHNLPVRIVAGILSATSVQKRWEENKRICEEFLECQKCKHTGRQKEKCFKILELSTFDFEDEKLDKLIMLHLGGNKTQSFYNNIIYPQTSRYVTLDTWMIKGFWYQSSKLTDKQYRLLSEPFVKKADEYKIPVPALQARIWCCIRENKIK